MPEMIMPVIKGRITVAPAVILEIGRAKVWIRWTAMLFVGHVSVPTHEEWSQVGPSGDYKTDQNLP